MGRYTKAGGLGVMAGYPESRTCRRNASVNGMNDVLRQEMVSKASSRAKEEASGPCSMSTIVPTQRAGLRALRAGVDLNIT